ncbi:hypothetical protein TWF281_009076 [Arthrobotrys megalospora]
MRTPIPLLNRILQHSLLTFLLLSHIKQVSSQPSSSTVTTSTLFQTIQNQKTVFISLNCPNPLPRCEFLQWNSFLPTTTTATTTTSLTPPPPLSTFVLHASEDGEDRYSLFDERSLSFVLGPLGIPGTRLATLMLTTDGGLVDAEDTSQVIFLRPNITNNLSARLHPKSKRQINNNNTNTNTGFEYGIILYDDETDTTPSDIQSTFLFNNADTLELQYGDTVYQSYKEIQQDDDRGLFNLYMGEKRDDTNSIPSSLETVDLNGIDITDITTSTTAVSTESDSISSSVSTGSTSVVSTPVTTTTARPVPTTGSITTSSEPTSRHMTTSNSMHSSSTHTPTSSETTSQTPEPITLVNEAYRIITSLGYQTYCSSLLDSIIIEDFTSTTKSGIKIEPSTHISTEYISAPTEVHYTYYTTSSGLAYSANQVANTVPNVGWRKKNQKLKLIKAHDIFQTLIPRTPPLAPEPLSPFPNGVLTEACEKAITRTTITKTNNIILTSPDSTTLSIISTTSTSHSTTGIPSTTTKTFIDLLPTSTFAFLGRGKMFLKDQNPVYGCKDLSDLTAIRLVAVNQRTQTSQETTAYSDWRIRYNTTDNYYYVGRAPNTGGGMVLVYKKNQTILADYALTIKFYDTVIGRVPPAAGDNVREYTLFYINYNTSPQAPIDDRYSFVPSIRPEMYSNGKIYSCQWRDRNGVIQSIDDFRQFYYVDMDKVSDVEFRRLVAGEGFDATLCRVSMDNKFQLYSPSLQSFNRRAGGRGERYMFEDS